MGELVHKDCPGEEPLDAALEHRYLQKLVDGWPLGWVPLEHHLDDVGDGGGEVRWQRRILALNNLLGQLMQ